MTRILFLLIACSFLACSSPAFQLASPSVAEDGSEAGAKTDAPDAEVQTGVDAPGDTGGFGEADAPEVPDAGADAQDVGVNDAVGDAQAEVEQDVLELDALADAGVEVDAPPDGCGLNNCNCEERTASGYDAWCPFDGFGNKQHVWVCDGDNHDMASPSVSPPKLACCLAQCVPPPSTEGCADACSWRITVSGYFWCCP